MSNISIAETVKEFFESGDPTIRQWPLVDSISLPFLCSALYITFVTRIGPPIMQNRKPFDLRGLMILYNFAIVVAYSICLSVLIYIFLTTDAYKEICAPTKVTMYSYTYYATYAGWMIYVLKYIEFADTMFFVLRKKNHLISTLHVVHHAALPIIGFVMLRTETSGFQFIPGGINCFIHIVMYTYYGLAAMGPEIQKYLWWKEYLTQLQMLQFVIILVFVLIIIPLSGCKTSQHGIYIDILFAMLFLALFINFYFKTYKKNKIAKNGIHKNGHANGHGNGIGGKKKLMVEESGKKKH